MAGGPTGAPPAGGAYSGAFAFGAGPVRAADAICYNCPPEWADWGSQLKAIQSTLGIQVPSDNKNSGQAIAALIAEKANPVADVTYLGGISADPAKDAESKE
jgi:putative spermidine/putrescine transport system substrate-binding protein